MECKHERLVTPDHNNFLREGTVRVAIGPGTSPTLTGAVVHPYTPRGRYPLPSTLGETLYDDPIRRTRFPPP